MASYIFTRTLSIWGFAEKNATKTTQNLEHFFPNINSATLLSSKEDIHGKTQAS